MAKALESIPLQEADFVIPEMENSKQNITEKSVEISKPNKRRKPQENQEPKKNLVKKKKLGKSQKDESDSDRDFLDIHSSPLIDHQENHVADLSQEKSFIITEKELQVITNIRTYHKVHINVARQQRIGQLNRKLSLIKDIIDNHRSCKHSF